MSARTISTYLTRRSIIFAATAILLVTGAAFSLIVHAWGSGSSGTAMPPPANPLQERLAAGEQTWRQAGIVNYRITVKDALSGVAVITHVIVVTVRDGKVSDQQLVQCKIGDNPCALDAKLDPSVDLSVPGLFAYTQANASNPNVETTIDLDPTYGFPRAIRTSLRNAVDASASRVVTGFEPLP